MENRLYLFAIRRVSEEGSVYGLPFPGTIETMKRDVRESLKGFDADMVKYFYVVPLCEYIPTAAHPLDYSGMYPEFKASDILAEGGAEDEKA